MLRCCRYMCAAVTFALLLSVPTDCQQVSNSNLEIDLGYARYEGFFDSTTSLYTWQGMQYGQVKRFERAVAPPKNDSLQQAYTQGPHCSQFAGQGVTGMNAPGVEQCLFVNVYVPEALRHSNGSAPVVVWIHGGGYGYGYPDAFGNATNAITPSRNAILVTIQYRLGTFGFLAGHEVFEHGATNVGISDQVFALQWVHDHISKFGGNTSHVTIWGESAGGGSVMLLTQAYGGELKDSLWQGTIANSPYLPIQYSYNDPVPTSFYDALVRLSGCGGSTSFKCLQEVPYETLFNYSVQVNAELAPYGTWSSNPVTDGLLLRAPPSQALYPAKVNGRHMFAGSLNHEGYVFLPMNISTESDFQDWFADEYPAVDADTRELIFEEYPSPEWSDGAYSNQLLRASALYGDATFLCPSYWLALSYPNGTGFKYENTIGTGYHGSDLGTFFNAQAMAGSAYNVTKARPIILGDMSAFWETWNPASNPLDQSLDFEPYDLASGYPEIVYGMGSNSTNAPITHRIVTTHMREPKVCTFWRAIGPKVPL